MNRASRKKMVINITILVFLATASGCGSIEYDNENYLESIESDNKSTYSETERQTFFTESESKASTTEFTETYLTEKVITTMDEVIVETTTEPSLDWNLDSHEVIESSEPKINLEQSQIETVSNSIEGGIEEYITEINSDYTENSEELYSETIDPWFDTIYDDSKYIPTGKTSSTISDSESSTLLTEINSISEEENSSSNTTDTSDNYTTKFDIMSETTKKSEIEVTSYSSEFVSETTVETKLSETTSEEIDTTTIDSNQSIIDIPNAVNPNTYNIKASDKSIVIDESVMTGEYGLLNLYEKYDGFHIAWKLKSLDSGKSLEFNNSEYEYFSSCCTIKAVFALYVCQQLERSDCKDTLDTKLFYDKTNPFHVHKGSGDIQKYGSKYYTIRELLEYCIKISDNDAYCVLLEHFGIENFNKWLSSIGSTSWVSKSNVMGYATINSRTIEWESIVDYCCNQTNKSEESKLLWEILNKANSSPIRNGLMKYTDLKATVAHKSGWFNGKSGTSNDCAIVTLNDGRQYLMIILTERYNGKYDNDLVEAIAADLTRFMDSLN